MEAMVTEAFSVVEGVEPRRLDSLLRPHVEDGDVQQCLERLLVLRRVVLGVLVQIAELARDLDLLRDLAPARPLELGELRLESAALRRTQLLAHERQARPCTSPSR